jgi:hypothetical protein
MAWGRVLVLSALNSCPPAQARFACPAVESNTRAGLFCGAFGRRTTQRPVPCPLAAMGARGKLLALAGIFSSAKSQNRHRGGHFLSLSRYDPSRSPLFEPDAPLLVGRSRRCARNLVGGRGRVRRRLQLGARVLGHAREIGRQSWRPHGLRFGLGAIVVWLGHGISSRREANYGRTSFVPMSVWAACTSGSHRYAAPARATATSSCAWRRARGRDDATQASSLPCAARDRPFSLSAIARSADRAGALLPDRAGS